jgi:hypothetical protein
MVMLAAASTIWYEGYRAETNDNLRNHAMVRIRSKALWPGGRIAVPRSRPASFPHVRRVTASPLAAARAQRHERMRPEVLRRASTSGRALACAKLGDGRSVLGYVENSAIVAIFEPPGTGPVRPELTTVAARLGIDCPPVESSTPWALALFRVTFNLDVGEQMVTHPDVKVPLLPVLLEPAESAPLPVLSAIGRSRTPPSNESGDGKALRRLIADNTVTPTVRNIARAFAVVFSTPPADAMVAAGLPLSVGDIVLDELADVPITAMPPGPPAHSTMTLNKHCRRPDGGATAVVLPG